jgi:hypothetical protein
VLVLVWPDDSGFGARRIAAYESQPGNFRFGERLHPVYVRPEAVMGAVFAGDLFHVAGTDRGAFFRNPEPAVVARAILEGRVRLVSFLPAASASDDGSSLTPAILSALRDATLTRHEIPLTLPFPGDPSRPALRFAYIERTDRAGAFEAEYRPPVQ